MKFSVLWLFICISSLSSNFVYPHHPKDVFHNDRNMCGPIEKPLVMCVEHSDVDESNFVKWKWLIATMIDSCAIQSWSLWDSLQSWCAHDMQGPFKVQSTVCFLFGSNT